MYHNFVTVCSNNFHYLYSGNLYNEVDENGLLGELAMKEKRFWLRTVILAIMLAAIGYTIYSNVLSRKRDSSGRFSTRFRTY